MSPKKSRECVYCGKVKPWTRDHIPPKNLFPKPRPPLITVPSCEDCNGGDSDDDEYFRWVLSQHTNTASESGPRALRDTIRRSLHMKGREGFKRGIMKASRFPENYDSSGNYDGPNPEFLVDLPRMKKVSNRVTKGLFYVHNNKQRLPNDYEIITLIEYEHMFFGRHIAEFFVHHLKDQSINQIGDGEVFGYQYTFPEPKDPNASVWYFCYYNNYPILSLTRKRKVRNMRNEKEGLSSGKLVLVPCSEE